MTVRSQDGIVVRSLVQRPVVDVGPEASLRVIAETLRDESVGALVVRGPHEAGAGVRASGLVSERDLVWAIAEGADLDSTRAEDVMTVDLAWAMPDEPVLTAAKRMLENEIRHLPVVEDGAVVGVISVRDALELLLARATDDLGA